MISMEGGREMMEVPTTSDKLELLFTGMERTHQLVPHGLMLREDIFTELTLGMILLKLTGLMYLREHQVDQDICQS